MRGKRVGAAERGLSPRNRGRGDVNGTDPHIPESAASGGAAANDGDAAAVAEGDVGMAEARRGERSLGLGAVAVAADGAEAGPAGRDGGSAAVGAVDNGQLAEEGLVEDARRVGAAAKADIRKRREAREGMVRAGGGGVGGVGARSLFGDVDNLEISLADRVDSQRVGADRSFADRHTTERDDERGRRGGGRRGGGARGGRQLLGVGGAVGVAFNAHAGVGPRRDGEGGGGGPIVLGITAVRTASVVISSVNLLRCCCWLRGGRKRRQVPDISLALRQYVDKGGVVGQRRDDGRVAARAGAQNTIVFTHLAPLLRLVEHFQGLDASLLLVRNVEL